ncbi:ASCH domain-containing protein [Nitrosospira sp. Nsp1]|uniref:ASCH domain-containing protein n=1 Tax=Nitrosospira sp. Nsp1 TaxID=136547 RepID=UPI00089191AB|nr:ASCH domain-containing protein [Nitrosospira sp. Nsp1]SCX40619.1 ASCH domain-containing protein [Nitrosospira sp. Nsp1]
MAAIDMKALSIRQPWAWLILHAGKDIENRSWSTKLRGRVLIHAAKGMTKDEYLMVSLCIAEMLPVFDLPSFKQLERGGIIGSVEIVDCVTRSKSPWFFGRYGFVLRNPKPLPFTPWRGQLGFFNVPVDAVAESHGND